MRTVLGEDTAADSTWSDAELLTYANTALDLRYAEMFDAQEGWLTTAITVNVVAGTASYAIAAGANAVRRVSRVIVSGGTTTKIPLNRDEKWHDTETTAGGSNTATDWVPTYRLVGANIAFDPVPAFSQTGGIEIETDPFPARLVDVNSTLRDADPDILEALLVYDVAWLAMASEGSVGKAEEGFDNHILGVRAQLERAFRSVIEKRDQGIVRTRPVRRGG